MIFTLGKEDSKTFIWESMTGRKDSSTLIFRVPEVGVSWGVLFPLLLPQLPSSRQAVTPIKRPLPLLYICRKSTRINGNNFVCTRDKHEILHIRGRDRRKHNDRRYLLRSHIPVWAQPGRIFQTRKLSPPYRSRGWPVSGHTLFFAYPEPHFPFLIRVFSCWSGKLMK